MEPGCGVGRLGLNPGIPRWCYSCRLMKTLNEVFTKLTMRRRYEVWFLRVGLGDGSGAWWFRYLLMNPGRGGCARGGFARAAGAGLGDVVSERGEAGDLGPGISG